MAHNRRLTDALFCWAQSAVRHSPGARQVYRRLRGRGQLHNQAIRVIAYKLVGKLHACLRDRTLYDEQRAWSSHLTEQAA